MPTGYKYSAEQTLDIKKKFLKYYKMYGVFSKAAAKAGISTRSIRQWMERDEKFCTLVENAYQIFLDSLEEISINRAKEKSDTLLMFHLRAGRPEKYNEKLIVEGKLKHTGGDEGDAPVHVKLSVDELTEEELAILRGNRSGR
jgi:hypothetical protein